MKIHENCFKKCTRLTKVVIPRIIKSIPKHAFEDCRFLKEVIIPFTIVTILTSMFEVDESELYLTGDKFMIYNEI